MPDRLCTIVALVALLPASLAAQRGPAAPTNVTITGAGTSATVTWTPVPIKGVTYRVLRADDPKSTGRDLTEPTAAISLVDPKVQQGATYFYQVIAVYRDGTLAAAVPVGFTVPMPAPGTPKPAFGQPIARPAGRYVPPAVTGLTVNGTTASATVAWQPVPGALSYSVARSTPAGYAPKTFPGLSTTTWTDPGPLGVGFPLAGVYTYVVTADMGGNATVSAQINWTRPNPTCAAPPPNQPMLTILDPTSGTQFTPFGPYPSGAAYIWALPKNSPLASVIAYRIERSVQGTNAWTLAATSCGVPSPITMGTGVAIAYFVDGLSGIVPNTTYLYRITALAANGEAGANTVSWTAPSQVIPNVLSATVSGTTVTLKWRWEPPPTNAPALPAIHRVTSSYGFSQGQPSGPCNNLAGCTLVIPSVPAGTHKFVVTAQWFVQLPAGFGGGYQAQLGPLVASVSAERSVVVP